MKYQTLKKRGHRVTINVLNKIGLKKETHWPRQQDILSDSYTITSWIIHSEKKRPLISQLMWRLKTCLTHTMSNYWESLPLKSCKFTERKNMMHLRPLMFTMHLYIYHSSSERMLLQTFNNSPNVCHIQSEEI